MSESLVWPDPVPCRSENPVQGIRQCEARRTSTRCRWLKVESCEVRVDDMLDALELLGLAEFTWLLEDDVDADDLPEAADDLSDALNSVTAGTRREREALASVRWFLGLLKSITMYGCGLSGRFAERLSGKDRY